MSLSSDILEQLGDYEVENIKIDREKKVKGRNVIKIALTLYGVTHFFEFAKDMGIDGAHMGKIIASYLRSNR